MEIISREKVEKKYFNVYVANDGTEFSDRDQCEKYEESAMGVLMSKIKPLMVREITTEDIHGYGSSDETVQIFKVESQEDADALLQTYFLTHDIKKDCTESWVIRAKDLIQRALNDKEMLFVSRGYEMDSFWIIGTQASMKESIDSICKKKEENA